MKTTYYGTWITSKEELVTRSFKVDLYDICKYAKNAKVIRNVRYTGVTAWDIIKGGGEAKQIECLADENSIDPYHEYLVLHFNDGTTITFRNSFCDVFIEF